MDPHNQHGAIGPIVGLVVILGIILAGGVYFYTTTQVDKTYTGSPEQTSEDTRPTMTTEDESNTITQISTQSTSTATADIQGDLNLFDASDIDSVGNDVN